MKIWATNKVFSAYFGSFYYPFEGADDKFSKLPKDEQIIYLSNVYKWTESTAYKVESKNLIRHVYKELATKPMDNVQLTAYRLVLLFLRENEQRMKAMSNNYKELIK